jgi:hypothetical protein
MPRRTDPRRERALRVTERDLQVLTDLGDYRFMSTPQLTALHFPSPARTQARLRQLVDAGLACKVFMPVRPYDASAKTIYALAGAGARLLVERRGGPRPRYLTERERRSGLFLDHTLRRNDLRVVLEQLHTQRVDVDFLTWRQAPEEVRAVVEAPVRTRRPERIPLVPDGFFALRHDGHCQGFLVEIDMGTVRLERMRARYRGYWAWHRWGRARTRYGPLPLRVLTLTTTARRLENLRKAAMKSPIGGTTGTNLFWFAQLDQLDLDAPEKLLAACWTTAQSRPGPPRPLLTHP